MLLSQWEIRGACGFCEITADFSLRSKVGTADSTGAGDAFNAGFVFGLANDYTIPDSIDFVSRVAALSVTKTGTVSGLPTFEEVQAFHQNHSIYQR